MADNRFTDMRCILTLAEYQKRR